MPRTGGTGGSTIIAHRGSSFLSPENTLAALKLGWSETEMCEVDVRLTRDGRLLVIHDATTKRTTGIDLDVARHTLRNLTRLDAGSWKGAAWSGEKFVPLEKALGAMPKAKRLLIEVKAGPEAVPELARVVRASGKGRRVLVHSFDFATCLAARKAMPRVPTYYLIAAKYDRRTRKWAPALADAVRMAQEARLAGIGANDTPQIKAAAVRKLHATGLKLNIWTVDRVPAARRLIAAGVDGLITNRPGWLKARL